MSPQVLNVLAFLRRNKLLILALVLVLFFLLILFLSATSPSENIQPNRTSTPGATAPSGGTNPTMKSQLDIQKPAIIWSPTRFSEDTLKNVQFTKTPAPEGGIKYSISSSNPNRPNEIIVEDGVVVYQRAVITDRYIYNYTNTLGAADFNFQSSRFYGPNTVTYVYLEEGTAFVADAKTTLVKEQLSFQPVSFDAFKQKYAQDIADFTIIPTLADEENARSDN
ncbi:MAG: hypothetical protein H0W89_03745 [Candidatus Levybacteria bacterium]|nr:hypothetical protein [Candidatus Levybacteria bacterium]